MTMIAPAAPPLAHRVASEFSGAHIAVLFATLLLLTSIPVFTHPLPPLSDYVNHLARMHVIATVEKNPLLAQFYEIGWAIIPNLIMDFVVPVLARFMNIYVAGQVFTILTFALIVSGTLALNHSLYGRWTVLPLAAFPLLYNYVFLVGLMNYCFGIGLALWALAAWIWLRERAWLLRLAVSTAFCVGLFFSHLTALGVYGLGLLGYELFRLWKLRDRPLGWRLLDFVATGLPFVPAFLMLLASPTMQLATKIYWEPRGKIDGLIYVIEVYSDIISFALAAIVITAGAWAVRKRLLRVHPVAYVLLAVSAIVYLVMPRVLFATYMADQRIPVAIAFMLLACVTLDISDQLVRRSFIAVLLILLAVRLIEVDVTWSALSQGTAEFRASTKRIKPGSKVLVAYADHSNGGDDVRDLGLVHAACIAMIDRSALVTTAFTVAGKQVLKVRAPYHEMVDNEDGTPPSTSQLIVAAERPTEDMPKFWRHWQDHFDYLYLLFTDDESDNPAPELLTLVQEGSRFQLYRIKRPATPGGVPGAEAAARP